MSIIVFVDGAILICSLSLLLVSHLQDENDAQKADYGSLKGEDFPVDEEEGKALLQRENANKKDALASRPHVPPQNPCLWLFHMLEGIAIATDICLFATQILPLFLVHNIDIGVLSLALKVYIAFFCILFVSTEVNIPIPFIQSSQLLQSYLSRGILYSFVGLICVEESYSERVKDILAHNKDSFHVGWPAIFMQLSSWFMLAVGLTYMLLGICCLKGMRDRMKANEIEAWREYHKNLKEWKSKYGR
jgi:hypothetical protein